MAAPPTPELPPITSHFDASSAGVLVIDANGIVVYVNPAAGRIFEQTPGEIVDTPAEILEPKPGERLGPPSTAALPNWATACAWTSATCWSITCPSMPTGRCAGCW